MAYYKVTQKQSGGSATLITKSITANGTYNASADNADGYSSVTVNTPSIPSGTHIDPWGIKSANQLNIKYQNSYYDIVNGALTDVIEFYVNTTSGYEGMSILIPNKYGLESGKTYTLRLSPDDFNFLTMQKRELVKGSGIPVEALEFIEDKTLTQGNAFIETGGGIFDCSVTTPLENLRKTLQVLSFQKD